MSRHNDYDVRRVPNTTHSHGKCGWNRWFEAVD